jgi:hypothetical protein
VSAPGYPFALTQQVPFEIIDAMLEQTCPVQRRVRVLPARIVVYLMLAGCLFAELGYAQVWPRLAAGLGGLLPRGGHGPVYGTTPLVLAALSLAR